MPRLVIPVFFLLFGWSAHLAGQTITPQALGFTPYTLTDDSLGTVNYYLTDSPDTAAAKPLLVYLDGSGAFPLFQRTTQGIGSTVLVNFRILAQDYRVLLISKPGVPFLDSVGRNEVGYPTYDEPQEYTERLSLDWRVLSTSRILDRLIEEGKVDASRVVLLGISEGAQVGPHVAAANPHVTHLLLLAGNGLNQFFDPIVTARQRALTGAATEAEAQAEVDSLFRVYRAIYADPSATDQTWWGHTYKRWGSFAAHDPYRTLAELSIPIYIANGSRDENSVLSADYIQLEFLRRGKDNLTYRTYPGYSHQFVDLTTSPPTPRHQEVLADALDWLATRR